MKYKSLVITNPEDLMFGIAPNPVKTRRGLEIGGGQVYAELNFTLPIMSINDSTLPQVYEHYREIAEGALSRVEKTVKLTTHFQFKLTTSFGAK